MAPHDAPAWRAAFTASASAVVRTSRKSRMLARRLNGSPFVSICLAICVNVGCPVWSPWVVVMAATVLASADLSVASRSDVEHAVSAGFPRL